MVEHERRPETHLVAEGIDEGAHERLDAGVGVEVAVGAFQGAEGDVNVEGEGSVRPHGRMVPLERCLATCGQTSLPPLFPSPKVCPYGVAARSSPTSPLPTVNLPVRRSLFATLPSPCSRAIPAVSCVPRTRARRYRWPGGCTGGGTTAASSSSTCATMTAWCRRCSIRRRTRRRMQSPTRAGASTCFSQRER